MYCFLVPAYHSKDTKDRIAISRAAEEHGHELQKELPRPKESNTLNYTVHAFAIRSRRFTLPNFIHPYLLYIYTQYSKKNYKKYSIFRCTRRFVSPRRVFGYLCKPLYTDTGHIMQWQQIKRQGKSYSFTIKQIIPPRALHHAHPNVPFQVLVSPPEKNPVHFHLQEMEPCQQHS